MDEVRVNAVLSLFMAACLIPLSTIFYALYWAGRVLTKPEDRTDLGNWLARFCLFVAVFMSAICVLTVNRWIDLNPDTDWLMIATVFRTVGVLTLVGALFSAHFIFPLLLSRIREGRL